VAACLHRVERVEFFLGGGDCDGSEMEVMRGCCDGFEMGWLWL
ncbi:hypothetical protein A2U01_0113842, partial [Trifolium medium]|nr:hypothetical protein [Trifolium medium]